MSTIRTVITPKVDARSLQIGPLHLLRLLRRHRQLIVQLARRQVDARFRGAYLGPALALLNPLLLLGLFTLVFTVVMPIASAADRAGFALRLFAGMLLFSLFQDTVARAPTAVTGNPNYVKKVVFPLEVLPVADLFAAIVLAGGQLAILLIAVVATGRWTAWWLALPVVVPPIALVTLGIAWLVASLGVYVRDIAATIGVFVTMLFYLTPVLYDLDQLGEWRWLAELNPMAAAVDSGRRLLVTGSSPDWPALAVSYCASMVVAWIGFAWFRATKRGFADVL